MQATGNHAKELDYGMLVSRKDVSDLSREMRFTEAHRRMAGQHRWLREVACLRVQTEEILLPPEAGDWFAGRIDRMLVGIDPERGDVVEAAWFCRFGLLREQMGRADVTEAVRDDIRSLLDYWSHEATAPRCRAAFPPETAAALPSDDYYGNREAAYPFYGFGGSCLDYDKLCRLGLPGLRAEVQAAVEARTAGEARTAVEARTDEPADPDALMFLTAMLEALDIVRDAALRYASVARRKADACGGTVEGTRFRRMEESLRAIADRAPRHYHEAIQLFWLYNLIALPRNYGRMDVWLGDFLAADLDAGVLSPSEALDMTCGLWRLIVARTDNFNNRILIGGQGRRNPDNADRFALLALEAQGIVRETIPQLSLRWHDGMNPAVWRKAFDVIASGSTFPILYNDAVNVEAVRKGFGISKEEAEQYVMYGCGEYLIDHRGTGSPDAALNVLKVLEQTLRTGFASFDALWAAFSARIEAIMGHLAVAQATIYRVTGEAAAFPLLSLLQDDCIARAKPILAGGTRYLGGTVECFGGNTAADALLAIRRAVFEEGWISLDRLVSLLETDFAGETASRERLSAYPKFGNDQAEADGMSILVHALTCRAADAAGRNAGLDTFRVVLINNGDSVLFGKTTGASADGRHAGEPVSNGNQPGAGRDAEGITALLLSMARLDPALHAGATHNLKVGRELAEAGRNKLMALVRGYFAAGGSQLMITVVDAGELEDALVHPQAHANLVVRVGGYSERFVNLPRDIQQEVLRRTLHRRSG